MRARENVFRRLQSAARQRTASPLPRAGFIILASKLKDSIYLCEGESGKESKNKERPNQILIILIAKSMETFSKRTVFYYVDGWPFRRRRLRPISPLGIAHKCMYCASALLPGRTPSEMLSC